MYSMKRTICPRAAEALDQIEHLAIVDAAHHDAIELDVPESGRLGGGNARQHFGRLRRGRRTACGRSAHRAYRARRSGASVPPRATPRRSAAAARRSSSARCPRPGESGAACAPVAAGRGATTARRRSGAACARPRLTNARAMRSISSKRRRSFLLRNTASSRELVFRHAVRAAEIAAVDDRDAQVAQRPRQRVARRCRSGAAE